MLRSRSAVQFAVLTLLVVGCSLPTAEAQRRKPVTKPTQPPKAPIAKPKDEFQPVHVHIQKGRYAEALEALDKLEKGKADPSRVALARSRCYRELGKWTEAEKVVTAAIKLTPRNAELHAVLAEIQFRTGRYADAEKTAAQAIKYDGQQPLAHLVLAEVYTETGRTKEALEGYRWFVRYYNRTQPKDAATLMLVARGSLQYARWKSVSQIYRFVINTLCPDALKADENSWQAHLVSGNVLLEKYNRAEALPDLEKALAVNSNSADALVALGEAARQKLDREKAEKYADQALKIVPNHVPALQLKADVLIARGDLNEAETVLKKALAVNPVEQRTLARLAACYVLADGPPAEKQLQDLLANIDAIKQFTAEKPSRFTKLVVEVTERNPRPGYFLTILADRVEDRRKYDLAARLFKTAMRVMPELSEPKTSLGMLYMRVGKTKEAQQILDDAFKADPFHVRVSNMRKVLKLLDGYETISTEHFVIRVDSQADKILGRYMAEYLEGIYPELVKQYGFEPPQRTQFEIYNHAQGMKGHEWFSARMIGLPWLHTVGASTGVIVALTSPTATDKPFNWARVLKHEFVHVITLQQTKFNIPHWFTEALAVTAEGYPRSDTWNRLLLQRVPKGELRTLANLNDGFIRPRNSLDWQFAYCQSRLYAQYMVENYGKESIPKMLNAYKQNLPTPKAVESACGVDIATFEKGYVEYLKKIVKELQAGRREPAKPIAELKKAYDANPDDTQAAAAYAHALFKAGQRNAARAIAEKVIAKNPKEPLAAVVMAGLSLLAEDSKTAVAYLETALDRKSPNRDVLLLLGRLKLEDQKNGDAADLLELGRKHFPHDDAILIELGRAYLRLDEYDKLKPLLETVAAQDFDDAAVRKKLAEISRAQKNYKDVVKFGRQVLHIDVLDVDTHRLLGEAYRELKEYKNSVGEYQVALELKPGDATLQLGLAKTHIAAGDKAKAKPLIEAVLKNDPQNTEAKSLLESLNQ